MASKNKLVRFKSIEVEDIFEKESALLKRIQVGGLSRVLMVWDDI